MLCVYLLIAHNFETHDCQASETGFVFILSLKFLHF